MKNKFANAFMAGQAVTKGYFRLQQFADDGDGEGSGGSGSGEGTGGSSGDGGSGSSGEGSDGSEGSGTGDGVKTYTDADVNAIIERKMAEWSKKKDKEISEAKAEAEKLAKMNAEQKRQYEYEKLQKENEAKDAEIAELKKTQLRAELSRSAAQIMKEQHEIVATQDMLDFVVGENAEETNQRIEKLIGIIRDDRKAQEKARATGKPPKSTGGAGGTVSEIDRRIAKYQ